MTRPTIITTTTQRYHRHDRKHIKVLVCDDSDIFILGIQTILASHYHFRVVGTARFLDELIEGIRVHRPHIVVLNEWLCNVDIMTALQRIFSVCGQHRCRVLVTGSLNDGFFIRDLMLAGVSGYLSKNDDLRPILVKALYSVLQDRVYLSTTANNEYSMIQQKVKPGVLQSQPINEEKREVLRMLANGMYPRAIASHMGISERRVYRLRQKLRTRFGARTNEELIRRAVAEGFVFLHPSIEMIQ